jgi:hypothetical protein
MSELRVESRLTAGTHSTYDLLTLLANEFIRSRLSSFMIVALSDDRLR